MTELLSPATIATALASLDGMWSADGPGLTRTVELPTFPDAIAAVDRVAVVAEEMNHHPDIDIRWRTLTFTCVTHSAGGVTASDVDLARRIDEILGQTR